MEEFIGLRISAELKSKLEGLAKEDRRPLSDYIRLILEQAAEDGYRSLAAKKSKRG